MNRDILVDIARRMRQGLKVAELEFPEKRKGKTLSEFRPLLEQVEAMNSLMQENETKVKIYDLARLDQLELELAFVRQRGKSNKDITERYAAEGKTSEAIAIFNHGFTQAVHELESHLIEQIETAKTELKQFLAEIEAPVV